ncbi:MAG: alpha/beta hydrolase [Myxococcales bacterium]|nr:alpha/beta hydrolase [Myxococcales bacterium]MCB9750225.1 alpha/beta hydrolase [Myxococcales bacterium]
MLTVTERVTRRVLNARGYTSRWLPTSVGRVHVLQRPGQGELPPVVLMHGISANGLSFTQMLGRFVAHARRVTAPDCPGHGFSDTPRGGLDRDSMLAGLRESLDRIIDEPVILLGTSMGGFVATRYAAENPDKVRALALVCPGGAPSSSDESFRQFLDTFDIQGHAKALEFVDRMLVRSPQGLRHVLAHGIRSRFSHPELRRLLASISVADMLRPDELARLSMPTLLLWGRDELILPPCHLDFFKQHMPPHVQIEEWSNFGHCGFLERPEAVARRVIRFARTAFSEESPGTVSTRVRKHDTLRISA